MNRTLLLFGHPDTGTWTFNHQLAAAYEKGVAAEGGTVERIDLGTLEFDPVLRTGYREKQALEPDLVRVGQAIERANHLAWFFPTYWAAPPALVRGLVDRLFLPGWAFRFEGHALPRGLLRGRSARVVTTMDSPGWWYRFMLHRTIHNSFGRATLAFCGVRPVRVTTIHGVRAFGESKRDAWCDRMFAIAKRDTKPAALAADERRLSLVGGTLAD